MVLLCQSWQFAPRRPFPVVQLKGRDAPAAQENLVIFRPAEQYVQEDYDLDIVGFQLVAAFFDFSLAERSLAKQHAVCSS